MRLTCFTERKSDSFRIDNGEESMRSQRELLEEEKENYEEKLEGLTSYIKELKNRTDTHDTEEAHFEDDLTKAEHDAKFYEGEIATIGALLGRADSGTRPAPSRGAAARITAMPSKVSLALISIAVLAGALLGLKLKSRGDK